MKIPQSQFYRKDKNTPAPNQRASSGQEKPFLCACGEKVSRGRHGKGQAWEDWESLFREKV